MVEIKMDTKPLMESLRRLKGIPGEMEKALQQSALFLTARIKDKIRTTFKKQSGRLLNSFTISPVQKEKDSLSIRIGTNLRYAKVHEFGMTIRSDKPMTVPLSSNPSPRKPALAWKGEGNSFVRDGVIFRDYQRRKPLPLFTLRHSVKIPKRPFVAPVLERYGPQIQEILGNHFRAELKRK